MRDHATPFCCLTGRLDEAHAIVSRLRHHLSGRARRKAEPPSRGYKLLIIDELDYVPLSTTGAELLFEVFSQRYERLHHRHQQSAIRRVERNLLPVAEGEGSPGWFRIRDPGGTSRRW
jgi:hypothetical protein